MSTNIQAIRGMNDIPPDEIAYWQLIEDAARRVLDSYGFREIRMPVVEKTELFKRSIGEVTDIVEKEMYTFSDRRGDSLTLRPEATASMVRAGVQHKLFEQVQRLWCTGPMFRYERPQKGRYRQFHQLDVEIFGLPGAEADAELILILCRLWAELGMTGLELQINTLGTKDVQAAYRHTLVRYFEQHKDSLDEDSTRRLTTNPLRILDSKNPDMQSLIEAAPKLVDELDDISATHFEALKNILRAAGVNHIVNPRLVRGLDYYTHTVFEWVTTDLGSQGAVCGGGRYDGLVEEIGGRATPATGFALGIERLVELLKVRGIAPPDTLPDAYLVALGDRACTGAPALAESLRDALPGLRLVVDAGVANIKKKMRAADRSGARYALLVGDDELDNQVTTVKSLRDSGEQQTLNQADLVTLLNAGLCER